MIISKWQYGATVIVIRSHPHSSSRPYYGNVWTTWHAWQSWAVCGSSEQGVKKALIYASYGRPQSKHVFSIQNLEHAVSTDLAGCCPALKEWLWFELETHHRPCRGGATRETSAPPGTDYTSPCHCKTCGHTQDSHSQTETHRSLGEAELINMAAHLQEGRLEVIKVRKPNTSSFCNLNVQTVGQATSTVTSPITTKYCDMIQILS